jgi:hypothetical protein
VPVAHAYNPSYSGVRQRSGGTPFEASLGKYFLRPYLEKTQDKKRADGVSQVVECLPSKHEALSSNPINTKKKKKKKKKKKVS